VIADVADAAVDHVRAIHPEVEVVEAEVLASLPIDIYAPCALGGVLNDQSVSQLQASVVCGAANNQLDHPQAGAMLHDRGIL
jgi:valine dehydrogenase (NAD+)